MFFDKKYKKIVICLLILLVQACSFGGHKKSNINNITSMKSVNSSNASNDKILISEDHNIQDGSFKSLKNKDCLCTETLINNRLPIFILTDIPNSFSAIYAQSLCNVLNNDVSNNKYIAVTHSLKDPKDALGYLRKDNLTANSKVPFIADFLITRTDYLFEKIKNNSGPLKDQPTLDVVMFLNGNYLFLWGNNKYEAIEFVDFVKKFKDSNPDHPLVIAVTNNFSKQLITKIMLANNISTEIQFVSLSNIDNLKNNNLTDYEIIAYAGPIIHNDVIKILKDYGNKQFTPLTLTEDIILNTQKANPEIIYSDITNYYSKSDIISIAMLASDNNLSIKNRKNNSSDNLFINDIENQNDSCKKNEQIPFINTNKYMENYDEKLFGKSQFNFNIAPVDEILEIKGKIVNISNIRVYSIGIRNVLLATRNTDVNKVFNLSCSFLSKYDLIKSMYPTPDMKLFTVKDLITGNLYENNLKYHYGILNFNIYAKNNNYDIVNDKAGIPFIISNNLTQINYPAFYGLELPSFQESKIISNSYIANVKYKRQEEVLKNLQIIIDSLKKDLDINYINQDIREYDTENISKKADNTVKSKFFNLNILDNCFIDDYTYLPFIN